MTSTSKQLYTKEGNSSKKQKKAIYKKFSEFVDRARKGISDQLLVDLLSLNEIDPNKIRKIQRKKTERLLIKGSVNYNDVLIKDMELNKKKCRQFLRYIKKKYDKPLSIRRIKLKEGLRDGLITEDVIDTTLPLCNNKNIIKAEWKLRERIKMNNAMKLAIRQRVDNILPMIAFRKCLVEYNTLVFTLYTKLQVKQIKKRAYDFREMLFALLKERDNFIEAYSITEDDIRKSFLLPDIIEESEFIDEDRIIPQ